MNRRIIIDFIVITITVSFFCRGLFSKGLPYGTDILILTTWLEFLRKYNLFFNIWIPLDSFGFPLPYEIPLNFTLIPFALIQDQVFATKLYLYLVVLFSGFSMYHFTYYYSHKNNASLFAAIIYIFNPFFLAEIYEGHWSFAFGYMLAPLLFIAYDHVFKTQKLRDIILFALILSTFLEGGHPETIYIFGSFLMLFTLFEILLPRKNVCKIHALKDISKVIFISTFLLLLLCAYQLLPIFCGAIPDVIFSLGYTIEEARNWSKDIKYILYIFLPFLTFFAILLRKDRKKLFFVLSAIISIFIALGPNPPLGEIYTWMFLHVPFFYIFRVPFRWLAMAILSLAFLIGSAFDAIVSSLIKSLSSISYIATVNTKFSQILSLTFFVLLFCSVGLSSINVSYPYNLGTYTIPEDYLKSYEWIGRQHGDFRVISLPYPSTYIKIKSISNFEGGSAWDPSYYSQAIHGKVIITGWGGMSSTRDFLDFVFSSILHHQTDDLMKILGAFNTRYLIIHPHQSFFIDSPTLEDEKRFFFKQKGLKTVCRYGDVSILENNYYTPHIFAATSGYGLVIGGLNVLTSLCEIEDFKVSEWNLIFANQLNLETLKKAFEIAPIVILSSDWNMDLAFMLIEEGIKIKASDYAFPSSDPSKYWIASKSWTDCGMLTMSRCSLMTSGSNNLNISFNVPSEGEYYVLLRVAFAPDRGKLSVLIDEHSILSVVPHANHYNGFRWLRSNPLYLKGGVHTLTIVNDGPGLNDIDIIYIVPPSIVEHKLNEVKEILRKSPSRILYILEAENAFSYQDLGEWYIEPKDTDASNGYSLIYWKDGHSNQLHADILTEKDARYMMAVRALAGPTGKLIIKVDNKYKFSISCHSLEWGWKWFSLGPFELQEGSHDISIESLGPSQFDEIILYSLQEMEDTIPLSNIFIRKSLNTIQINYELHDSNKYTVHIKTDYPFFLVFSESYHPLWKCFINDSDIPSIPSYSFLNGFYINQTGEFTVTIEFIGQKYVLIGGIVSLFTLVIIILYVLLSNTKVRQKTKMILLIANNVLHHG
jgi:hypothetical protein